MNANEWKKVRELFDGALELPENARAQWLNAACADEPHLRVQVQELLDADADALQQTLSGINGLAPDLLDAMSQTTEADATAALIGTRLGAWRLVREVGRGGMGAVYLAERDDGAYQQQAAIKLIRAGWDSDALMQRFRAERQILAGLNHPNIASLLDGGLSSDGKPYLVLEYVQGVEFARYCNQHNLGIDARLRLFLTVCAAVSYAHTRLVVHRDLKPANILVNESGQVKLLDFGIAKLIDPVAGIQESATRMFTPECAAPEQIRGETASTGVDVYALGVLLFTVLTGRRPYSAANTTPAAYEQAILTQEPLRPSSAALTPQPEPEGLRALAQPFGLTPNHLSKTLRGDLDAIILKALRKEPEQRYGTVAEFARDIERHLARLPVSARRGNFRYHATRFLQRHALAVALVTLATLSLLGGLGLTLWQADQARKQRDLAQTQASNARAVAEFVTGVFDAADPTSNDGANPRASELLDKGRAELAERNDLQPATRVALLVALGNAYIGVSKPELGIESMQEALQQAQRSDSPASMVAALHGLGYAHNANRHDQQALELLQRAHALAQQHPEIDLILRENVAFLLGLQLHNLARYKEALPLLKSTYEARAARLPASNQERISAMTMYTTALARRGDAELALAIIEPSYQASKSDEKMPLKRQKDILAARAYPLLTLERYGEAELDYREVLRLDEQVFGVGDLRTSVSMNNLAICLSRQSRFTQARDVMKRVVAIYRAKGQTDDTQVAFALVNLASILRKANDPAAALTALEEALGIFARRADVNDLQATKARFEMALTHEALGQFEAALQSLELLRAIAEKDPARYIYIRNPEPDLLSARLRTRLNRLPKDCALFELKQFPKLLPKQELEANILQSQCALENLSPEAARAIFRPLTRDPAALQVLPRYVAALHADLQKRLASTDSP